MHLSGNLAQSIFLSATSSLEQPALFPVELRGAPHHQFVPPISREMFGGEKLTQFSPLIPFNPALGNWKWCVFPHTTPCYLKRKDKKLYTLQFPALHRSPLWGTAGIWIWQRSESILHISMNLQPQALNRKKEYVPLFNHCNMSFSLS